MKIGIGNDHIGFKLKNEIVYYLKNKGYEVVDFGHYSEEKTDYPIHGEIIGNAVVNGEVDYGILISSTGVGISIAANKVKGVRAVLCSEPITAAMSRKYVNSNVLTLGACIVNINKARKIIDSWLKTSYEGKINEIRVQMINKIEERQEK